VEVLSHAGRRRGKNPEPEVTSTSETGSDVHSRICIYVWREKPKVETAHCPVAPVKIRLENVFVPKKKKKLERRQQKNPLSCYIRTRKYLYYVQHNANANSE
jgi:hypothetical protein